MEDNYSEPIIFFLSSFTEIFNWEFICSRSPYLLKVFINILQNMKLSEIPLMQEFSQQMLLSLLHQIDPSKLFPIFTQILSESLNNEEKTKLNVTIMIRIIQNGSYFDEEQFTQILSLSSNSSIL